MKTKAEAIAQLREWIKPGDTVYTVLRHVSRSGMQRIIGVVMDAPMLDRTYLVGVALGYSFDDNRNGLRVTGCGTDMGFEVVYNLGRVLFPDGFAPSTRAVRPIDGKTVNVDVGRGMNAGPMTRAEFAALHARGWKFTRGRNGDTSGWDSDGGYALTHRRI